MTNTNICLKAKPFLLTPIGKDYLWGGNRLNDDFAKELNCTPLAESWECSTHKDGESIINSGNYQGRSLKTVLMEHPEYLGKYKSTDGELPILVKFIDANKDLSIQVHPDDTYAKEHENGENGKTEFWYVLDATQDAYLTYGFQRDLTKEELQKSLEEGTVEKYLQKKKIQKDDIFYIEAGTVHGIGAGALVAEIQENSNVTYRMYDYNREDKQGKKRELHLDKAVEVANRKASLTPRQPMRVLKYKRGYASELLCRCQYFQVERQLFSTYRCRELAKVQMKEDTFQVFLCLSGCGTLLQEQGEDIQFFKGDCIFIPANSEPLKIHGMAEMLVVSC